MCQYYLVEKKRNCSRKQEPFCKVHDKKETKIENKVKRYEDKIKNIGNNEEEQKNMLIEGAFLYLDIVDNKKLSEKQRDNCLKVIDMIK